jgi:hypothetical protein
MIGILAILIAPFCEPKWARFARPLSVWGLVATSLVVWILAPSAASSFSWRVAWKLSGRPDPLWSFATMAGWALFAIAHVAPALPRREPTREEGSRRLIARGGSERADGLILAVGMIVAAALQCIGWGVEEPERAILIRLVALFAGVMVIGASTTIVLARHAPRKTLPAVKRAKRAVLPLVLFGLWVVAGAVLELAPRR